MEPGYVIVYVSDVAAALDFYERAYGMTRRLLHESGDFGELSTDGARLAFTSHRLGESTVPVRYTPLDPAEPPAGFEFTMLATDVGARRPADSVEARQRARRGSLSGKARCRTQVDTSLAA